MIRHTLFRSLRRLGRDHSTLRPAVKICSRILLGFYAGGARSVTSEEMYRALLSELNIVPQLQWQQHIDDIFTDRSLVDAFYPNSSPSAEAPAAWKERVYRIVGHATLYYALVREMKPNIAVETGTASGGYTALILAAMHKNKKGRLISIDIPPVKGTLTMSTTVSPDRIGHLIPECYKYRWDYREGDAKFLLPKVLQENEVDLFIHDSLHTRTHMLFEYSTARALLKEGSIIASDDILWNGVFDQFLSIVRLYGYSPLEDPGIGAFVNKYSWSEKKNTFRNYASTSINRSDHATPFDARTDPD